MPLRRFKVEYILVAIDETFELHADEKILSAEYDFRQEKVRLLILRRA